jgi:hypothetical protein
VSVADAQGGTIYGGFNPTSLFHANNSHNFAVENDFLLYQNYVGGTIANVVNCDLSGFSYTGSMALIPQLSADMSGAYVSPLLSVKDTTGTIYAGFNEQQIFHDNNDHSFFVSNETYHFNNATIQTECDLSGFSIKSNGGNDYLFASFEQQTFIRPGLNIVDLSNASIFGVMDTQMYFTTPNNSGISVKDEWFKYDLNGTHQILCDISGTQFSNTIQVSGIAQANTFRFGGTAVSWGGVVQLANGQATITLTDISGNNTYFCLVTYQNMGSNPGILSASITHNIGTTVVVTISSYNHSGGHALNTNDTNFVAYTVFAH